MTRIRADKLWDLSQPIRHGGPGHLVLPEGCGGAWTRAVAWELDEDRDGD
jgi:hypothetical protein